MSATSKTGSVSVGGSNSGFLFNTNASGDADVKIEINQQIVRELPSFLGKIIVYFSQQQIAAYAKGARRDIPPEVLEKLLYNSLDQDSSLIRDYTRHVRLLDQSYAGVEQSNQDVRYLVRRKAATAYASALKEACDTALVPREGRRDFAKSHPEEVIETVIRLLLDDYKNSSESKVEEEFAHLAISLIVADAVIECEVLERPPYAITT